LGMGIIALLFLFLGSRSMPGAERRPDSAARVFLMLTGAAVVLFTAAAISEPMWSNDYLAIWGFKAKTIFLSQSIPWRLFHDPVTTWSHPEYPLFLPLTLAALSATIGNWDDHALAMIFPLFQMTLLATLYGWTKRRFSARAGAVAALLAASYFWLFRAFEVGMAEIPLAAALVLFAASAIDFVEAPGRARGARLAISALVAATIKQEGSLFVLLVAAWIVLRALRGRRALVVPLLSLTAVPVFLHEIVLTAVRGRVADRDYDWSWARPEKWPVVAQRAGSVLERVLRSQVAPAWLPLAAVLAFLLLSRPAGGSRTLLFLGPPLLAQAGLYAVVCAFSSIDPLWQAQFLPRLVGALFPVLLLAAGPRFAFVCAGGDSGRVPIPQAAG